MPAYNVLFFGALSFILGIFLAGVHAHWITFALSAFAALVSAGLFFWKRDKKYLAFFFLSPLIFAGAFYAEAFDMNLKAGAAAYDATSTFDGRVVEVQSSDYTASLVTVELGTGTRVLLKLRRYEEVKYGDEIRFVGKIKQPPAGWYADYLLKESITGVSNFPQIISMRSNEAGYEKYLFDLKEKTIDVFRKTFPEKEGAFLSGLTLGYRGGFSDDFNAAMRSSGTTHLVALSGYNISLVVVGTMIVFSFFLPRVAAFLLTSVFILLFVIMTGAEASVVRAAIFGFLALFAKESGRPFDPRNIIILAALLMLFINPRLLVFDVGFELSFAAFLGIIYLKPAIESAARFLSGEGFMGWRKNLAMTASAQLAVLPIILGSFGSISPFSLVSNVLIINFVPVTMILGFLETALGFVSAHLASAVAFFTLPFLKFETGIIEFFGGLHSLVSFSFGTPLTVLYYVGLVAFTAWRRKKTIRN